MPLNVEAIRTFHYPELYYKYIFGDNPINKYTSGSLIVYNMYVVAYTTNNYTLTCVFCTHLKKVNSPFNILSPATNGKPRE